VRLVLTLELRQALAEQLSARAIRSGKNLEAVVIDMLEAGAKREALRPCIKTWTLW